MPLIGPNFRSQKLLGKFMTKLKGKVAIVTGAAVGLGKSGAKRLLDDGARIVTADYNQDEGKAIAEAFGTYTVFPDCNVSNLDSVAGMLDAAIEYR